MGRCAPMRIARPQAAQGHPWPGAGIDGAQVSSLPPDAIEERFRFRFTEPVNAETAQLLSKVVEMKVLSFYWTITLIHRKAAMELIDRVAHRLKLRDLRLLDTVVRVRGMAKAARQLNISQPAVSKA